MCDFDKILNSTHIVPFGENYRIYDFDSGIPEYNEFLISKAQYLQECNISHTQLLIDNFTGDVVGYFSLCTASIGLTNAEKETHEMEDIKFNSIPVLKIGKLAIDKQYRRKIKGYGSYTILLIRGIAAEINENGIACRFIVVDVDIQYDSKTIDFYIKNGFVVNESIRTKSDSQTISMRLDIFSDIDDEELESTGTDN
jgi:hypothetical protein